MAKYVCGIDIGTTGVKVMIFNLKGKVKGSAYTEYLCTFPQPGWCEQDGNMTWVATCRTAKQAIEKSGVFPEQIVAIGLSTQRCTITPIDERGNPLRMGLSWQDNRGTKEVDYIAEVIGNEKFYDIVGTPNSTLLPVSEILWVKNNEPEIYDKTYKFVLDQERILHKLGVEGFQTDWANGSMYGLMNVETFEWDLELTKKLGIDPDKLPGLVPSGTVLGKISAEVSEITGFAEGTLLVAGAGDQQCAGIGAGAIKNGVIEVAMGTSGVTLGFMDKPNKDKTMGLPCAGHSIPGKWECEGLQNAAAASFKWYRNEFAYQEGIIADVTNKDVYDVIDEEIEKTTPGCNGLICLPYLAGQAAPHWDPVASGTFVGLTLGHKRTDFARAIMEGVTYEAKEIIERMISNGMEVDTIYLNGGGAKGDIWCQIQADMYGKTCYTLNVDEATTLGAAILAAVGAGLFDKKTDITGLSDPNEIFAKKVETAVSSMIKRKKTYEPIPEHTEIYDRYFAIYKDIYKALSDAQVYKRLRDLVDDLNAEE